MANTQYSWARGRSGNAIPSFGTLTVNGSGNIDTANPAPQGSTSNADIQCKNVSTVYTITLSNQFPVVAQCFLSLHVGTGAANLSDVKVTGITGQTVTFEYNVEGQAVQLLPAGAVIDVLINCNETLVS